MILDSQPLGVDAAVEIILQTASALEGIHQKELLHQNIQPGSILIKQEKAVSLKLANFGLNILMDISRVSEPQEVVSTFGYMAPESTGILRKPIDSRSDIYSLGILFYRIVTGSLPYDATDAATLIHQHIAQKPIVPSKLNGQIPLVLENIILRLIAKEPQERYQSLSGLIVDLKEYQKQRLEGKSPIDFEIARSDRLAQISFSSKLIGRDEEIARLNQMLENAKDGRGSLCFVFGEPGIGKSRLVDELRGRIHSLGGLFVGGKCYQFELRTPYKVFSETIDAYVEKVKRLPFTEQEAHIKRAKEVLGELGGEVVKVVPSITDLIGKPPALTGLEPDKERTRFLITLSNFLAALGSSQSPLLMFLDDLQWADDGSLDILARLAEKCQSNSLLIVASYRDNEVDINHPLAQFISRLKQQNIFISEIPVKAFGIKETTQMLSQILLEKEETVFLLAQQLHFKAKGNPFFTLELLHTLVDEQIVFLKEDHYTYDLDKLKQAALPDNIIEIVVKRIKDIPGEDLKILSYASVMGKEMQFGLLTELTQRPFEAVLNAIENGIQNQLLMRDLTGREDIFFMHDRIREAFYKRVSEDERVPLHRRIGEALEQQNIANLDPILYDLAYHFTQGGLTEKALQYCLPAANKARSSYANSLAINLYNTAKGILEKRGQKQSAQYIEVLENLGEAYRLSAKFDASLEVLSACEAIMPSSDKLHKTSVLSKMGDSYFEKGDIDNSIKVLEKALGILGIRIPGKMGVNMGIPREFLIMMVRSKFPGLFPRRKMDSLNMTIFKLITRVDYIYYFVDTDKMFYVYLLVCNFAEQFDNKAALASLYANSPAVWVTFPWYSKAFASGQRALKLAQESGDKLNEGRAYTYLALASRVANKPKDGLEYAQKAINILKGIGEYWDLGVAYTFRNHCNWMLSRFKQCIQDDMEFLSVSRDAKILQPLGWAYFTPTIVAGAYNAVEIDDELIKNSKEAIRLLKETKDKPNIVWSTIALAMVYMRQGNFDEAVKMAQEAVDLFPTHYNKGTWILDVFSAAAQVYLAAVTEAADIPVGKKKEFLKRADELCRQSIAWAKKFEYLRPWTAQVKGVCLWLGGRKKEALRVWGEGIELLRVKGEDKYRLASILFEQSRFLLQDNARDKKAYEYLIEAREIFNTIDCKRDLANCDKILESIAPEGEGMDSRQVLTQKRHLDSLLSVTQAIGSVFVLEDLLDRIMEYGLKVTGAERGFLLLHDQKKSALALKVSHGLEKDLQDLPFSYDNYKISLELIKEVQERNAASIADPQAAPNAKISNELKGFQVRQAIVIPLRTREKSLGVLYMDNRLAGGMFGKDELELMKSFAVQASVSIENAFLVSSLMEQERLKQEMELGREIQLALLPKTSPEIEGLKVYGLMMAAKEIGGDYYDFVQIPDKQALAVVIGDVSGKGVGAGLLMSMVKATIHTLSQEEDSPRRILIRTNQMLHQNIGAQKFMTLLYFIWHPQNKMLTYSSAGHEHIIIYRTAKLAMEIVQSGGFMLGMIPSIDNFLEDRNIELHPQDKVILYTDGVTEARNPEEELFTLKRLTDIVFKYGHKPAEELLDIIKQEVYSFIGTRDQYDDITLVVMEAT
ncbi:MAG: SpoIIE family protein phosphatase [Candidatus Omnitrophota bacterium]